MIVSQRFKPFGTGKIGLFTKKAFCANCGYTMMSSKNHGKHYLQCPCRHIAKDACIGSFIGVEKLEKIILNELKKLSDEYLDKTEVERNIEFTDHNSQRKLILEKELLAYEKKLSEYSKDVQKL